MRLQPDGHDDDDRQQRRDRAVDADERGQQRDEQPREEQQPGAALLAGLGDEQLAGPGGDAGPLQAGADDEQRRDEDHRGVAEAGERLVERKHARRVEGDGGAHRDDDDRQPVPDEQDDRGHDDRGGECYWAHWTCSLS